MSTRSLLHLRKVRSSGKDYAPQTATDRDPQAFEVAGYPRFDWYDHCTDKHRILRLVQSL